MFKEEINVRKSNVLNQATDLIKDGMLLGIGGNGMHRTQPYSLWP